MADEPIRESILRWAEAANRGDAEAAYKIAECALTHDGMHDREAAEAWMRRAAQLGDVPMLWRLAELATRHSARVAAERQRAAIEAEWSDTGPVVVDPGCFPLRGVHGDEHFPTQDFRVRVTGEPAGAVLAALENSLERLFLVGDDGTEYADVDAVLDAEYSPNFVSDPEPHPDGGWSIWLDCKGEAYPLMAGAFLRILVGELRSAQVTAARITGRTR
ncbi:MAG: hypothetical protein HOU81_11545 [Hamadaea sp.]|uniref:hypothetical protein n=1 Tax=Hamadaea sp. TaxID=2024425 RepID=UPI0017AB2368|nr:hypothetical protein [Hamadaea sp.]NUR71446.1 hypothetical protein [Hamadaea sp.]NUT23756.1 hypothetical protein [Hamadaea sp.]